MTYEIKTFYGMLLAGYRPGHYYHRGHDYGWSWFLGQQSGNCYEFERDFLDQYGVV